MPHFCRLPFPRSKPKAQAAPLLLAGPLSRQKSSRREKRSLLRLPTEILLEVVSYLPPVAKVCLALASKHLLAVVGEDALATEELQFPRLVRKDGVCIPVKMPMDRWTFLGMLENDRLIYCSRCLKLHPPSYCFSPNGDRWSRHCSGLAGVVEICPCIRLTWGDKQRLERYLKRPSSCQDKDYFKRRKKLYFADGALKHQCTHEWKGNVVHLHVRATLDDGSVVFVIKFYLITSRQQRSRDELPCKVCEHRSLDDMVDYRPKTLEHHLSECTLSDICQLCDTAISDFRRRTVHGRDAFSWTARRGLGKEIDRPGVKFYRQTDKSYEQFNDTDWLAVCVKRSPHQE